MKILEFADVRAGEECAECGGLAVCAVCVNTTSQTTYRAPLCVTHKTAALAAVAAATRSELGLCSLGDAASSGKSFRRPTWPKNYYVRNYFALNKLQMFLHIDHVAITPWSPTIEDTCALDYVLF